MSQDRLSELAIIKMNNEIDIDYEEIIDEFAKLKSRNFDFFKFFLLITVPCFI